MPDDFRFNPAMAESVKMSGPASDSGFLFVA